MGSVLVLLLISFEKDIENDGMEYMELLMGYGL